MNRDAVLIQKAGMNGLASVRSVAHSAAQLLMLGLLHALAKLQCLSPKVIQFFLSCRQTLCKAEQNVRRARVN